MSPHDLPLWECCCISKAYPGVVANDRVNLRLMKGRIHGLLGENGCGKSTLIKTLAGIQQPDSGVLKFDGEPVRLLNPDDARRHGTATVFQEFSLVPSLSVAENIFLARLPMKRGLVDWPTARANAKTVLDRMGIDIDPTSTCGDLSVGEQQLVEIAKALSLEARLIILDEPTAALGEHEIEQLHGLLRKLRDQGCAILYVSHRLDEVERIVDEVTVLRGGKVVSASGETRVQVDEIVRAMVGEVVSEHYPKERNASDITVFEARDIRTHHIHGASFDLKKGEVLGFGGVLGSGRSELARAVLGLDPLTAGEMTLKGQAFAPRSIRNAIELGVGLVPENRKSDGLFPNFRANGNVTAAGLGALSRLGIMNLARETQTTERLVEQLEVSPSAISKTIGLLSGGNQQKLILARWLFAEVDVLILDEPTQGIDIGAKIAVYRLINEMTRQGKSVILISSDHDELLAMSDRVALVRQGRVFHTVAASELSHDDLVRAAGQPSSTSKKDKDAYHAAYS